MFCTLPPFYWLDRASANSFSIRMQQEHISCNAPHVSTVDVDDTLPVYLLLLLWQIRIELRQLLVHRRGTRKRVDQLILNAVPIHQNI
jgi:hypothetical protein